MGLLNTILDIVFPVNCLFCHAGGSAICSSCLAQFPRAERPTEEWIYTVFDYRDEKVKKVVWELKYSGRRSLAKYLGEIIAEHIAQELSELEGLENFSNPILIPIPLSRKRYKERGYNQAELLARAISKSNLQLKSLNNVLIKTRETEHQARIKDREARLKNLVGTFGVKNAEKIKGRNLILVDDVTTTGATLSEARKILRNSGANKVIAFTLAH